MKKLIYIIFILSYIYSNQIFSQINIRSGNYYITPDSITTFGMNLPAGTIVYNEDNNKLWILISPVGSGKSLYTTSSKIRTYTGLEKITESGKTGWALTNDDRSFKNNIGTRGLDFSVGNGTNPSGATGEDAISFGVNALSASSRSFIAGGQANSITGNSANSFAANYNNKIINGTSSFVTGTNNIIKADYSAILGGANIIAYNNKTVYVPYLNLAYKPTSGSTSTDSVLVWSTTDSTVKMVSPSTLSGSGSVDLKNFTFKTDTALVESTPYFVRTGSNIFKIGTHVPNIITGSYITNTSNTYSLTDNTREYLLIPNTTSDNEYHSISSIGKNYYNIYVKSTGLYSINYADSIKIGNDKIIITSGKFDNSKRQKIIIDSISIKVPLLTDNIISTSDTTSLVTKGWVQNQINDSSLLEVGTVPYSVRNRNMSTKPTQVGSSIATNELYLVQPMNPNSTGGFNNSWDTRWLSANKELVVQQDETIHTENAGMSRDSTDAANGSVLRALLSYGFRKIIIDTIYNIDSATLNGNIEFISGAKLIASGNLISNNAKIESAPSEYDNIIGEITSGSYEKINAPDTVKLVTIKLNNAFNTSVAGSIIPTYNYRIGQNDSLGYLETDRVDNINDLRSVDSSSEFVYVKGYYNDGDGGGGYFYWDASSSETDNGGTIIKLTSVATGRYYRIFSNISRPEWFGAKYNDSTFDNAAAIEGAASVAEIIELSDDTLYVKSQIDIDKSYTLQGSENSWISLNTTSSIYTLRSDNVSGIKIKDVNFDINSPTTPGNYGGLVFNAANNVIFDNVTIINAGNYAIYCIGNSHDFYLTNCNVSAPTGTTKIGLYFKQPDYDSLFAVSVVNSTFTNSSIYINKVLHYYNGCFINNNILNMEINSSKEPIIIKSNNAIISNNKITGGNYATFVGRNIKITNNHFTDVKTYSIEISNAPEIQVVGNTIVGNSLRIKRGICFSSGVGVENNNSLLISNQIKKSNYGIWATNTDNLIINNNKIDSCDNTAIYLNGADYIIMTSNKIDSCNIAITTTESYVSVVNNIIKNCNYGINSSNDSTTVTANLFQNVGTIVKSGTQYEIIANIGYDNNYLTGKIQTGTVTWPNTKGTAGQTLYEDGTGTLTFSSLKTINGNSLWGMDDVTISGGSSVLIKVSDWVTGATTAARGVQLRDSLANYATNDIYWDITADFDSCTFGDRAVYFQPGKYIDATGDVYISGTYIVAGVQKIFTNTTSLQGDADIDKVYVDWFGTDAADFEKCASVFGRIDLAAHTYTITSNIDISGDVVVRGIPTKSIVDMGTSQWNILNNTEIYGVSFLDGNTTYATVYLIQASAEDSINIKIDNCKFTGKYTAISTGSLDATYAGVNNFRVTNSVFDSIRMGVRVEVALIGGAYIGYNTFKNYVRSTGTSEMYNINVGKASDITAVDGITIEGNESYGHSMTDNSLSPINMFLRCYATNVLITKNYLHDTECATGTTYGFEGIYMNGNNITCSGNTIVNWQKGTNGSSITFKRGTEDTGRQQFVDHNVIINNDTSLDVLAYSVYGDGAVNFKNNYIYTYHDSTDVTYPDVHFAFSYGVEKTENETGLIEGNWIISDRVMLSLGAKSSGVVTRAQHIVRNNVFQSEHAASVTQNYNTAISEFSTAISVEQTIIDGNIFRMTNGKSAYNNSAKGKESIRFINNDVEIKRTSATSSTSYTALFSSDTTYRTEISGNTFNLYGLHVFGGLSAKNEIVNNNKINLDFQFTSSSILFCILPGSDLQDKNYTFTNNIVTVSDSTTNGADIRLLSFTTAKDKSVINNNRVINNSAATADFSNVQSTIGLYSKDNYFDGLDVGYGEYVAGNFICDGDVMTGGTNYMKNRSSGSKIEFYNLDLTTTSDAIDLRGSYTDMYLKKCVINGTKDIQLYNATVTNLYGVNGDDFTWDFIGTGSITNTWGLNQTDADLTYKNEIGSVENLTVNNEFTYVDNAYGEVYYSGAGVTITTSGSANRLVITNATNDMFSIRHNKNITLSGDTTFFGTTGMLKIQLVGTAHNSGTTCSDAEIMLEIYNSSNTLVDSISPQTVGRCDTESYPVNGIGLVEIPTNGYYMIGRIKGGAVDVTITSMVFLISKQDKYTAP